MKYIIFYPNRNVGYYENNELYALYRYYEGDGIKYWWKYEKLHREDGSAIEKDNGEKQWFVNGKRHRLDGPAVDYHRYKEWWYYGEKINCNSTEEFLKLIKLKAFW